MQQEKVGLHPLFGCRGCEKKCLFNSSVSSKLPEEGPHSRHYPYTKRHGGESYSCNSTRSDERQMG